MSENDSFTNWATNCSVKLALVYTYMWLSYSLKLEVEEEKVRSSLHNTKHKHIKTVFMIHVQFLVQITKPTKSLFIFLWAMLPSPETDQSSSYPNPNPLSLHSTPFSLWHTLKLLTYTPNWYAARRVNNQKRGKLGLFLVDLECALSLSVFSPTFSILCWQ